MEPGQGADHEETNGAGPKGRKDTAARGGSEAGRRRAHSSRAAGVERDDWCRQGGGRSVRGGQCRGVTATGSFVVAGEAFGRGGVVCRRNGCQQRKRGQRTAAAAATSKRQGRDGFQLPPAVMQRK